MLTLTPPRTTTLRTSVSRVSTRKHTRCILNNFKSKVSKDEFKSFAQNISDSRKKDLDKVSEKLDDIGRQEAEHFVSLLNMHVDFIKEIFDVEEDNNVPTIEIIEPTIEINEDPFNDEYFET
jgi:hypothetical protein